MPPSALDNFSTNLGHLANTAYTESLLRGDYTFPEECDPATEAILQEIVPIFSQQQIPMDICIEPTNFHWWRTAREKTESSRSLISFSHYKTQSHSKTLTALQVKKINLTLCIGLSLERWLHEILVLIEKESGNIYIDKLWSIIWLKADFNWLLKIIISKKLMGRTIAMNLLPQEFFD